VIYIGESRERALAKYPRLEYYCQHCQQPNCRRQAATCTLPRRNPAVTPTVSAVSPLLRRWPHRARNVLNKLCQSGIRAAWSESRTYPYTTLVPRSSGIRMLSLRCILPARFFLRFLLGREGHHEIDRERSSTVRAEIDFALVAIDVPPINRGQISGFARVTAWVVSMRIFCSILSIITLSEIVLFTWDASNRI